MVFNVRVCFSCTSIILNANNYVLACVFFLCFSVIHEFLLSKACIHSDLLSARGPEKAREGKQMQEEGEGRLRQLEPNPPSRASLCVLLSHELAAFSLVLGCFSGSEQPYLGLIGPPPPPPSSLEDKRAPCSSVLSVFFSKIQLQKKKKAARPADGNCVFAAIM